MVLEGMVPVLMQTPPTTVRASTTTTRLFILDAATAARWPAGPEPMTMRSYLTALIEVFLPGLDSGFACKGTRLARQGRYQVLWRGYHNRGRDLMTGEGGECGLPAAVVGQKKRAGGAPARARRKPMPGLADSGVRLTKVRSGLRMHRAEGGCFRGLRWGREFTAGLIFIAQSELADHLVEVAGERG